MKIKLRGKVFIKSIVVLGGKKGKNRNVKKRKMSKRKILMRSNNYCSYREGLEGESLMG